MSNATQHSRKSGDRQRRRSRGGRNRDRDQHRGGDREGREGRNRAEEFRPQGARPPRTPAPAKLTWWQKILKAVGLYKAPAAPAREQRKAPHTQEPRPAKSNTRNARSSEGAAVDKEPTAKGGRERSRGGDKSTVESPRVYVGNLSYDVTEQDLQELFKGIGGVRNVEIVYNRSTHRSKGYGFVEMLRFEEAVRAVEVLHDQPFMGRKLNVSGAKSKGQDEREEREDRAERSPRPVVVAPRPAAAAATAATAASDEPQIQTIVETVVPLADEPQTTEWPADAPTDAEPPASDAPEVTSLDEAPAVSEAAVVPAAEIAAVNDVPTPVSEASGEEKPYLDPLPEASPEAIEAAVGADTGSEDPLEPRP